MKSESPMETTHHIKASKKFRAKNQSQMADSPLTTVDSPLTGQT